MELSSNIAEIKYNNFLKSSQIQKENLLSEPEKRYNVNEDKLKKEIANFTSIFVKKMFEVMRQTVPEKELIDGGFAEEVFTDMLDQEISEKTARQDTFKELNRIIFELIQKSKYYFLCIS